MRRRCIIVVIAPVLALVGCTQWSLPSAPPEHFAPLIQAATMDSQAVSTCESVYPGLESGSDAARLLAAVDSTVGGIRELGGKAGVIEDYDEGLPIRKDAYMAICILDVSNNEKVRPVVGMAVWAGEDPQVTSGPGGGSGMISAWGE